MVILKNLDKLLALVTHKIIKPNFKGSDDFIKFADEVTEDFNNNYIEILEQVKTIGNKIDIDVVDVELYGSYATGKANENSDIDLLIKYKGDMDIYEVADKFRNKIMSVNGVYDIVAKRMD